MNKKIVILGAGTGGTIMANRLKRRSTAKLDLEITIVDQDDRHVYQPGLLFVPFGLCKPDEIVRERHAQLAPGIRYLQSKIDRVEVAERVVRLTDGSRLPYDVLVIATGAELLPGETEGMLGAGWRETVFDFYTLEGASALARKLEQWRAGHLVINVVDMPIKCPVAPLEFAFLADWYFQERGVREETRITYVTPLDGAFTKPVATRHLQGLLDSKNIEMVTDFATGSVHGEDGKLVSYDEREVDFDLLVSVPLHGGGEYISRSAGLGDELNFVVTDPKSLQCRVSPNVFALGDVTTLPTSKAGSVTHFEADVLADNIIRFLAGKDVQPEYDGHANCFVETGFGKAMLIDFNYDQEPVPGRFPSGLGPMPLLKEARINHLGKLMFQWLYWNVLLPGRSVPGIPTLMSLSGKDLPATDSSQAQE